MITEKVTALAVAQVTGGMALATGKSLEVATQRAMNSVRRRRARKSAAALALVGRHYGRLNTNVSFVG